MGIIEGNWSTLVGQIVAIVVTYVLAIVGTLVLGLIIRAVMGLRVEADVEQRGLDITMHGEEGYII